MTKAQPIPRFQRRWLILYWLSLPVTFFLLVQAVLNFTALTFTSLVALLLATLALGLGLVFATRLTRAGMDDVAFVKSTTTFRVISIAWLLIQAGIWSGAIVATIADVEVADVDWTGGFTGTVGSLSILAMVGPGYSEYREGMKASRRGASQDAPEAHPAG